ncbi:MAG: L-threonylcarbamoyladenylate synthase [Clostridia bacterium]|nr:threonylcarbamoyl-AMP synthase [Clostridium sp.]
MSKYLNLEKNPKYINLKEPAQIIQEGGIVIFPTETVYGIGVNGLNETAIKKLYEVKQRPINKPISLLVNSIEMIEKVAKDITEIEYDLIKRFLPGPLTIVLKKKDIVPDIVTAGFDTIGIRMPENEIALKLIEYAGVPIATPSANISGRPSGTNLKAIMKDFNDKVDYFIDGGISKIGVASTIVQVVNDNPYILRKGKISEEQIKEQVLLSKQKNRIIKGK